MEDSFIAFALLGLAALAAGAVNAIAGGGTLLTFPALNGVIEAVPANATNAFALLPGSIAGGVGFRQEVARMRRPLAWLLIPSLLGGAAGALLLLRLDASIFKKAIPFLILTASLLLVAQKPVSRWLARRSQSGQAGLPMPVGVVLQFAIAVYGGYFGAGIGILMLSLLGLLAVGDIHHMNAVKNVLACAINATATMLFILKGQVVWQYGLPMAACALAGGYLSAYFSRRLPQAAVRAFVTVIGFGLAAFYFYREWLIG